MDDSVVTAGARKTPPAPRLSELARGRGGGGRLATGTGSKTPEVRAAYSRDPERVAACGGTEQGRGLSGGQCT